MYTLIEEPSATPVSIYPHWDAVADNSPPFLLPCDASVVSFIGTLERSIRSTVATSRATLESERHWTPLDLEAGTIVHIIKRLHRYLWGIAFRIVSEDAQELGQGC